MSATREVYRAEQLPVFQNRMFGSRQAARECTRGDLVLVQDAVSGLVYNRAFDPSLLAYDADYQNEQGHSATFGRHLDEIATLMQRHFEGRNLIEVGCGKGLFLEKLSGLGFRITGLDPTYEGDDPDNRREYFSPALGLRADGLVLRHVLEHVADPYAFLCQLRDANGGSGRIYIAVPCLDWIARYHAWFDLFYEHVNYFRLSDFRRLFADVHEAGHSLGSQYLAVVAELATLRAPNSQPAERFDLPTDFMASDTSCRTVARASPRMPTGRFRVRQCIQGRPLRAGHGTGGRSIGLRHRHESGQAGALHRSHGAARSCSRSGIATHAAGR